MWPARLTRLLGIDYPILASPMAGVSTPALAAAVSNAGGLGALGNARATVDEFAKAVAEVRLQSNRPFAVNFFCHREPRPDPTRERRLRELLDPYYDELGISPPAEINVAPPFGPAMLEAALAAHPAVANFHFGLPGAAALAKLKEAGIIVIGSATTVAEAQALEQGGVDAIVAQGVEAGGHRGTFLGSLENGRIGTMALVPQVVDAVRVPVIAAGGIADGRGVAAALALGAAGAQIGTAFIPTPESGAHAIVKASVMAARDDATRITTAFTGRPARVVGNRFVAEMAALEAGLPDYPIPLALTQSLGAAAVQRGSTDFSAMHAGQAAALARGLPAGELFARLVEETEAVWAGVARAARPARPRARKPAKKRRARTSAAKPRAMARSRRTPRRR
jgi:nitronate monooxygenase